MKIRDIIKIKENGRELSYKHFEFVINGYLKEKISYDDMSLFIKAIYDKGMNREETYFLTDVMVKSGLTIDLSKIKNVTVDKHSSGGIGDKTSLIVLPICASLGVSVPKMSGRSLGITGGTVDKLESIPGFKSNLSIKKFIDIVNTIGCADISQSKEIALADKYIYKLRDEINCVDSIPLIASSIMSKKIACGSKNIVIDLKVGKGAFVNDIRRGKKLAKLMIYIGKKYKRNVVCILSDMNSPLGSNIGNILEIKEVINFFDGIRDRRLEELVIKLCGYMVSISKKISLSSSEREVKLVLKNGLAKNKFYEWISAQGGDLSKMKMNAKRIDVRSVATGYVTEINAKKLGELATYLGAGRMQKNSSINPSVGLVLRKKIGDFVEKNEIIGTIYYTKIEDGMVNTFLSSYRLENKPKKEKSIILKIMK